MVHLLLCCSQLSHSLIADKIFKSSYTTDSYRKTLIFDHAHSITIKVTFSFLKYVLACKNLARFIHSLKLESHAHFWPHPPKNFNFPESASAWKISSVHRLTLWPGWPRPFLITSTPVFFYQLLIFGINMSKSRLFYYFILDKYFFEILQSDWPTTFWPYMTEKQTNRKLFQFKAKSIQMHIYTSWYK